MVLALFSFSWDKNHIVSQCAQTQHQTLYAPSENFHQLTQSDTEMNITYYLGFSRFINWFKFAEPLTMQLQNNLFSLICYSYISSGSQVTPAMCSKITLVGPMIPPGLQDLKLGQLFPGKFPTYCSWPLKQPS